MYLYAYFSGKIYMADVTGDLGGQPIQLNNAATEATLKQLLAAMTVIANNTGKDKGAQAKSKAELEKELQKLADAAKNQTRQTDAATKAQKNLNQSLTDSAAQSKRAQELAEKSEQATVFAMNKLEQFGQTALNTATKLTNVMSSFAGMGNSFSGAAATFNNIPVIGGMLGTVFGAVAGAADKLYTSFRTGASVGASFGGDIIEMGRYASNAGLTFEQYGQVISKNGEALAYLGGTTTEGAKRLSKFTNTLKSTGLQDELARIGYSSEDIANGMAQTAGRLAKAGVTRGMSDEKVAAVTAGYLQNLDAVSRMTGKNKDALQAEADARMADSQYRLMLAKLDPDGAANLEMLMSSIPKEHQAGLKEIMATGTAVSKEAQAAMYFMNQTGQNTVELGEQMRRSGTLTKEQVTTFDKARKAEARQMAEEAKQGVGLISTLGNFGDSVQQAYTVGIMNSATQKDLTEIQAEQAKEKAKAAELEKTAMDPAKLLQFQQTIAETSNKFNETLANVLPKLQGAFTQLAEFVEKYLVPAFQFFAKHIEAISIGIGAFIVVVAAAKAALAAFKAFQTWQALGKQPGHPGMPPLNVIEVGGGLGTDGPDKKGKKGAKGSKGAKAATSVAKGADSVASGAKGLVKGLGVAGTVLSIGMLAGDISDINEKEKSGEISKREADVGKGEAVGGAVGGAGGAFAGAAAGAAIGSVVPILGTVVGGAIGAAIGGYLGSKGGEMAGKATAELVVGPPGAGEKGTEQWLKINDPNINSWVNAVYEGRQKIGAVPGVYLPYVKERLAKKPAKATPTPPAKPSATTPAPSATTKAAEVPGINYSADSEALLKQFAARNNSVLAAPNNPSSANTSAPVTSAQNQLGQDAEKKAAEEARQRAAATDPRRLDQTSTQETQGIAITALNTNMEQMVKLLKDQVKLSENQISATKSLSSDLFAA
jgi:hypothetical protein